MSWALIFSPSPPHPKVAILIHRGGISGETAVSTQIATSTTKPTKQDVTASKESQQFQDLLRDYHKISTSRKQARERLLAEHGIAVRQVEFSLFVPRINDHLSERTIARRWQELGLVASRKQEEKLTRARVRELVEEEMENDPDGQMGQNAIKANIAMRTGLHLKR